MKIANNPKAIDFLLDEQKPIEDRLREHNKYDCLAFIHRPGWLYRPFAELFKDNAEYQKAFEVAKKEAIKTIHDKRKSLGYEGFIRYLFFELGQTADHWGEQSLATHENKNKNEPFVYNIVPGNQKEAEILERVCIDHIKSRDGKGLGADRAFRAGKTLFIGYNSLELLKEKLETSLKQPHSDKKQVVSRFREKFIKPLRDTETTSLPQRIYRNIKSGTTEPPFFLSRYYIYYTTKATVIELIKFEDYLNEMEGKAGAEKTKPDYKNQYWFKVGLLFATGKIDKYIKITTKGEIIFKNGYTSPKVAKELGDDSLNKFILATVNNYPKTNSNGNKNIFNSKDRMQKIIDHCKQNDISITDYFLSRLPTD